MKKQLTKKETLTSGSGVQYFKLTFGNQWFNIMPWQYEPAKLMNVFKLCADSVEGETYDIKWRSAKIGGRPSTLITQINLVEEEFVWDGEEMGGDDSSNSSPQPHSNEFGGQPNQPYQEPSKTPQNAPEPFDPFGDDEWEDLPF